MIMKDYIYYIKGNPALNEWHVFKDYWKAYAWCMGEGISENQIIKMPVDSRGHAYLYASKGCR
ncbi:MAG: hypothetical protein ACI4C4_07100 [Lachnospiraceae bacterium]